MAISRSRTRMDSRSDIPCDPSRITAFSFSFVYPEGRVNYFLSRNYYVRARRSLGHTTPRRFRPRPALRTRYSCVGSPNGSSPRVRCSRARSDLDVLRLHPTNSILGPHSIVSPCWTARLCRAMAPVTSGHHSLLSVISCAWLDSRSAIRGFPKKPLLLDSSHPPAPWEGSSPSASQIKDDQVAWALHFVMGEPATRLSPVKPSAKKKQISGLDFVFCSLPRCPPPPLPSCHGSRVLTASTPPTGLGE